MTAENSLSCSGIIHTGGTLQLERLGAPGVEDVEYFMEAI